MMQQLSDNEERISFSELFTQCISDITLEVEAIKIESMKNDVQGINKHVTRIISALLDISDAKLELAERCNSVSN
ncbi:MAG: hypothetical protein HY222_07420 [Thaumarchaeota archaeon]|nr:hypothetical protein [Nitrososphaerota archaeon]MBI3642204.1 hypothetical protein [Nitrososphaerota archaeon]